MAKKTEEVKNNKFEVKPLVSEKSYAYANALNKYTFAIPVNVEKIEVKKEIERKYKVKIIDVNMVTRPGKMKTDWKKNIKRRGQDKKKVIVTLKKGDKINEFFSI